MIIMLLRKCPYKTQHGILYFVFFKPPVGKKIYRGGENENGRVFSADWQV